MRAMMPVLGSNCLEVVLSVVMTCVDKETRIAETRSCVYAGLLVIRETVFLA